MRACLNGQQQRQRQRCVWRRQQEQLEICKFVLPFSPPFVVPSLLFLFVVFLRVVHVCFRFSMRFMLLVLCFCFSSSRSLQHLLHYSHILLPLCKFLFEFFNKFSLISAIFFHFLHLAFISLSHTYTVKKLYRILTRRAFGGDRRREGTILPGQRRRRRRRNRKKIKAVAGDATRREYVKPV